MTYLRPFRVKPFGIGTRGGSDRLNHSGGRGREEEGRGYSQRGKARIEPPASANRGGGGVRIKPLRGTGGRKDVDLGGNSFPWMGK